MISPVTPNRERVLIPQLPPKHAKAQQNNRSVVLQVVAPPNGGQPQLEINQQNVSWDDLDNRLVDIYKTRAQKVLFVKADNNVPWEDVATVIDDAHSVGVGHVGLITAEIEASMHGVVQVESEQPS